MPTLLETIQSEAVDGKSDLSTLLRKCKVLAASLDSLPLEDWLVWESNGYPEGVDVPAYRTWPLIVKGTFLGVGGGGYQNVPIPMACLDQETRNLYENFQCRQGIESIEQAVRVGDRNPLSVDTSDLALSIGTRVYKNQNWVQAWAEFDLGQFIELLNAVRNRILDFSLALGKEAPSAGDVPSIATSLLESGRVTQIFNMTISGGTANIVGVADQSEIMFDISVGDFDSLREALLGNDITSNDVEALRVAIQEDKAEPVHTGFGPRVSKWVGSMTEKASSGTWSVSLSTASNLLASVLSKYFGM